MSRLWTLLDVLRWSVSFFTEKGVPNARLDAENILAHVLRLPRLELYLRFAQPLTPDERDAIRRLVVRRANREPLQYILGEVEFLDNRLKVDSRALIPRPETEFLAQRILDECPAAQSALDVCTGGGAIAIALAGAIERVMGVDISEEALSLARENAALNNTEVEFLQGDLLVPASGLFDVIVSNPPYVTEEEFDKLAPEITMYEPRLALVAPEDGLAFYRRIVNDAPQRLAPGGRLYFEIGHEQSDAVARLATDAGWRVLEVAKDLAGFDRNIILVRD
ncbi:MAG: peptide chain release factor N(5)-glutamine methyltransferase [Candidatus Cloacimonetes bacterium]|nr:peptide chain release factor N(5)-glutamine methyltransferase [Candidatus Cloacimonadota bacterium]